jgi:hypothetical protein
MRREFGSEGEARETIFTDISQQFRERTEEIKEQDLLGRIEEVGRLTDELGQFLCDVTQELQRRAQYVDSLCEKYPRCIHEIAAFKQSILKACGGYIGIYRDIQKHQKTGRLPTQLPDLDFLLTSNGGEEIQ